MKTLTTIIAILLSSIVFAQQDEGITLTIIFDNLISNEGKVTAALYDEATFMKTAPLGAAEAKPENKELSLTIENVLPGAYAIITLHDYNENGRMDFEPNGMPKEPYGTSNNVLAMGPPNFEDAKFTVGTEDMTLHIKM